MDHFKPPTCLSLDGNIADNWRKWKQRYLLYSEAAELTEKTEDIQASTLLCAIGDEALEVYNSFSWATPGDQKVVSTILQKFDEYCIPPANTTYQRHIFNTRSQHEGETIDHYVTDLRNKAKTCDFGTLNDSLIRDRIVCGIRNDQVRIRLLREKNLDLVTAVGICRANELSSSQMKDLTSAVDVNRIEKKPDSRFRSNQHNSSPQTRYGSQYNNSCWNCGGNHRRGDPCPAFGAHCRNCDKRNHYSHLCRSKPMNQRQDMPRQNSFRPNSKVYACEPVQDDELFIGMVGDDKVSKDEWKVNFDINKKQVSFCIDTGADCNVIPLSVLHSVSSVPVMQLSTKLRVFGGKHLHTCGSTTLPVNYKGNNWSIKFFVVDSDVPCIIGHKSSLDLGLIQRIYSLSEILSTSANMNSKQILDCYKDVFEGLGCIKGVTHHIETDLSVPPVVHPPRKIPVPLREKVKEELQRMERLGVLEKVESPTEWVSSMVTVLKSSGKLRLCIDPKDLNSAIKREHYPMLTIEEVVSRMPQAKVFSKLDATHGFWQVALDEESSRKCTFNTPEGRFCFKRLPFGISSAPEVFQKIASQMFEGIEGVEIIVDDILVWGTDMDSHNTHLVRALDKCRERGLKLNKDKCDIGKNKITYVGHTLTDMGLRPDHVKVEAIHQMDKPDSVEAIQRFLGMVKYLSKFIPNFSQISAPLRLLTEKETEWHWNEEQEKGFQKLKDAIANAPVLSYFDLKKTTKLSVDASSKGMGAVLLQDDQPVAYASRALSSAEQNYAQIEKEMLAITFGCEKFHQYIFGQKLVQVESDHKPLEIILKKPLHQAPSRLQKMMMKLQKYSLDVVYKPGKELYIADTLSRACSARTETAVEEEFEVNMFASLPISENKFESIKKATDADNVLQQLKTIVLNGWPENQKQVLNSLIPFWNVRDEITAYEGVLFKCNRVIVPDTMKSEMLKIIHSSHLGVEKCKNRARDILFWPDMNKDIDLEVSKCSTCNQNRNKQQKEPLQPHTVPDKPWSFLGSDLFTWNGHNYLILVDSYSGFF